MYTKEQILPIEKDKYGKYSKRGHYCICASGDVYTIPMKWAKKSYDSFFITASITLP